MTIFQYLNLNLPNTNLVIKNNLRGVKIWPYQKSKYSTHPQRRKKADKRQMQNFVFQNCDFLQIMFFKLSFFF